jgi:hypothetical protein
MNSVVAIIPEFILLIISSWMKFRFITAPPEYLSFAVTEISEEHVASSACYLLHFSLLLGLFFDPEDIGDMFKNTG